MAKKLLKNLSDKLGTEIQVGRIRYGFNRSLIIRDLFVGDQNNDTLLYINRIEAGINDIDLNSHKISINELNIQHLQSKIYQNIDSLFNYSFIIDNWNNHDSKPFTWQINCDKFSVQNSAVSYTALNSEVLFFDEVKLRAADIEVDSLQQQLKLNQFETQLNRKHFINSLTTNIIKKRDQLRIDHFHFLTDNSFLNINSASLNIPNKTKHIPFTFIADVSSSKIISSDFSIIIPKLKTINDVINFSGQINGNLNNMQGKSIKLSTGRESNLMCDFNILNYSDPENINYNFDIQNFYINKSDLTHFFTEVLKRDSSLIPRQILDIQNISYSGIVNGNYYNLFNKGRLSSPLGQLATNVTLKRNPQNDKILIDGNIQSDPLYIEPLLKNKYLNEVAFDLTGKGYYSETEGSNFDLTGQIKHIEFNHRSLDSIGISGNIDNERFVGRISSFDPDLRFDFDGTIKMDTLPSYDFLLNVYYANLVGLGLNTKDSLANLSFVVKADFQGNTIDNSEGELQVSDLYYFYDTNYFATDSILITSRQIEQGKELHFYSEYAEAHIVGRYNSLTLVRSFKTLLNNYLPSLGITPKKFEYNNEFSFDLIANYPHPITELLVPNLRISPGTYVYGEFKDSSQTINLTCSSGQIEYNGRKMNNFGIKAFTRNNQISVNLTSKEFNYFQNNSLKNFSVSSTIFNDSIRTNFNWNNWLDLNYSGNINSLLTLTHSSNPSKPNLRFDIYPSNIIVLDTLWYLSKGVIQRDSSGIAFHNLKIDNGISSWYMGGVLSDNPNDSISLILDDVSMDHLNVLLKNDHLLFGGRITGTTLIRDIKKEVKINSDFFIENLSLNDELIGDTRLRTKWDAPNKSLIVHARSINHGVESFGFNGTISPAKKQIDVDTYFNKQPFKVLQPFLEPTFDKVEGTLEGKIKVYGDLTNPSWKGSVYADHARLLLAPTNVFYTFNDSVFFEKHDIVFNNVTAFDVDKDSLTLSGRIWHNYFRDFFYGLKIESPKILAIDLKSKDSPYYYGTMYGSGYVEITGPDNIVDINIVAKTESPSFIMIPLEGKGDIKDNDFVEFVNHFDAAKNNGNGSDNKNIQNTIVQPSAVTNLHMDLNVTPDIEVQILFDPRIGDRLRANGFAHLTLESLGPDFNMYGDYNITKGDFTFTLQNVINKRLEIQQGSSISWTGAPLDADINLDAIYKVRKASVYDLTLDVNDKEKRVEVNTHLLMSGKLVNPLIKFAVNVPSATNDEAIDQLNSLPEEDLNKQVISLLLLNRFTSLTAYQTGMTNSNTGVDLTATTASELLSNQLTNWLSKISNDFDLGFVYRPGDENTQQEYEVALSYNLFNDRVLFNGNVGYSENQRLLTNNPYTTDFQLEYKVNRKGNIRLRAFQKLNNDITYSHGPYTQGIGIFYTEDFNNFDELLQKIFHRESATKPEDVKIPDEDNNSAN